MKRLILTVLSIILLASCARVPTSGPIQEVGPLGGSGREPGVVVDARPPEDGATPALIVEGFLAASESGADDYAIARQYLTPAAAASWRPATGAVVYHTVGSAGVVTTDEAATLEGSVIGHLDTSRRFESLPQQPLTHNFGLQQINGQWRISNPGDQILISQRRFERSFDRYELFFLDSTGSRLLTDSVLLRASEVRPDTFVQLLAAGPGEWLAPVLSTGLPAGSATGGTYIENDIAIVSLGSEAEQLNSHQRLSAAAQIFHTLQEPFDISGIRIEVDGRPLQIDGAGFDGIVREDAFEFLIPSSEPPAQDAFGIRDGQVYWLGDSSSSRVRPVDGPFGSSAWGDRAVEISVTRNAERLAIINADRNRVYSAPAWSGQSSVVYEAEGLVSLHYDAVSYLWVLRNAEAGVELVRVSPFGEVETIVVSELPGRTARAFHISPDMSRIVVVADAGDRAELGMLWLNRGKTVEVGGWRPMPIYHSAGELTHIRDAQFTDASHIMLLGSTSAQGNVTAYTTDTYAARVDSQGPLTNVSLVTVSAAGSPLSNAALALTSDGEVLRYESQFQWSHYASDVTAIAHPG